MDNKLWMARKHGWFRWRVEQLVFADWAGSGYRFHKRSNGLTRTFWTRVQAQRCADALNRGEG